MVSFDPGGPPRELRVPGSLLRPGQVNHFELQLPDARHPTPRELAQLGMRYLPHRLGLSNVQIALSETAVEDCE
jgi:hypothetical protein